MAKLLLIFTTLLTFSAKAQIQQAWVVRYNHGITNGTNGLMQFADTNAPNFPARFYHTNPQ